MKCRMLCIIGYLHLSIGKPRDFLYSPRFSCTRICSADDSEFSSSLCKFIKLPTDHGYTGDPEKRNKHIDPIGGKYFFLQFVYKFIFRVSREKHTCNKGSIRPHQTIGTESLIPDFCKGFPFGVYDFGIKTIVFERRSKVPDDFICNLHLIFHVFFVFNYFSNYTLDILTDQNG